ncbi:MAG: S-methyl-5-thioribose-1-phosphate isomerase [Deltaproteobacteria bacterium]|nr:S-methyl-5-thioribose-1-phosphate isomerase [Deltaproteobacteria bacterium]
MEIRTAVVAWRAQADALVILDQRALPAREVHLVLRSAVEVADAIKVLAVRGAPLIGAAAAYGLWLGARVAADHPDRLDDAVEEARRVLAASRPTAVNLFHALDAGMAAWRAAVGDPATRVAALRRAADDLARADAVACERMARLGGALLPDEGGVLTHCNAGALATCGVGTALGVIRGALALGKKLRVFADETRPLLQGARLTAWELLRDGVDVTLLPDGAAASLLRSGAVGAVVVGADRIARNGDVANKVGTYPLALAAHAHGVPFYVAAPTTTLDAATPDGSGIVIEERAAAEVETLGGTRVAAEGVRVFNPAFDVTPARLVTAIITDAGVARPPGENTLQALWGR